MVTNLIIPFIAVCIVVVMVDRLAMVAESIIHKIPYLPDRFEGPVAYAVVFAFSYLVCWRGNFDFFASLNFSFQHDWEGWIMTALLLSGGSAFVKASFGIINTMPQVVSNVYSTVSGFFGSSQSVTATSTNADQATPESNEEGSN